MALKRYGVLKGTVTGHLRDADDDHYQVLVRAGSDLHRIAVNVKSSAPKAPSTLLFLARRSLPGAYVRKLHQLKPGYARLPSRAGGLALDYVRSGWVKRASMTEVPPDRPGVDNDLKDKIEGAVVEAMDQAGSVIYAFGEKWGPEKGRRDQYFRFLPGNGIHDIHMNQGNSGKYKKDNGTYQDGGVVIEYPDGGLLAFFLAFQSQSFETDERGNPKAGVGRRAVAGKRATGSARAGKGRKPSVARSRRRAPGRRSSARRAGR